MKKSSTHGPFLRKPAVTEEVECAPSGVKVGTAPFELERISGSVMVPARPGPEDDDGKVVVLNISPPSSRYFDARMLGLVGIDQTDMSECPFLVRGITVGGWSQMRLNSKPPASPVQSILSDVFRREPLCVSWQPFSKEGSGLELSIHLFSLCDREIKVYGYVWGVPIHDLALYRKEQAEKVS